VAKNKKAFRVWVGSNFSIDIGAFMQLHHFDMRLCLLVQKKERKQNIFSRLGKISSVYAY